MADQSASFYGSCCFFPGDVKLTLGTGAFLDINVGSAPIVSKKGTEIMERRSTKYRRLIETYTYLLVNFSKDSILS